MTVSTFIIEWDSENPSTMIVAEQTLRMKANQLKRMVYDWANKEVDINGY